MPENVCKAGQGRRSTLHFTDSKILTYPQYEVIKLDLYITVTPPLTLQLYNCLVVLDVCLTFSPSFTPTFQLDIIPHPQFFLNTVQIELCIWFHVVLKVLERCFCCCKQP